MSITDAIRVSGASQFEALKETDQVGLFDKSGVRWVEIFSDFNLFL